MTNAHLTTEELILFMDREMKRPDALAAEKHLLACQNCSRALAKLSLGSEAYTSYRKQVMEPAFPVPVSGWTPIGGRLAAERSKERRPIHPVILWAAAAASLCIAIMSWWYVQRPTEPSAQQILTKAESAPDLERRNLVFAVGHERLVRRQCWRRAIRRLASSTYTRCLWKRTTVGRTRSVHAPSRIGGVNCPISATLSPRFTRRTDKTSIESERALMMAFLPLCFACLRVCNLPPDARQL